MTASRRSRTSSGALATRSCTRSRGTSRRCTSFSASTTSRAARFASVAMPVSDNRAPWLSATLRATSRSPHSTSTSVTGSESVARPEMASRCAWLPVVATAVRSRSLKRAERARTGAATVISGSAASRRMTSGGALRKGASRRDSSTKRLAVHRHDHAAEQPVEQVDLLLGEPTGVGEEEIRDATHRLDVLGNRNPGERLFELGNQGCLSSGHRPTLGETSGHDATASMVNETLLPHPPAARRYPAKCRQRQGISSRRTVAIPGRLCHKPAFSPPG